MYTSENDIGLEWLPGYDWKDSPFERSSAAMFYTRFWGNITDDIHTTTMSTGGQQSNGIGHKLRQKIGIKSCVVNEVNGFRDY